MKNNESIRIAVAETSVIIRSGLTLALKRLPNLKIQPVELLSVEALNDCLRTQFPDILVVNPTFGDFFDVARFREETAGKGIRVVALVSSFIDASLLSKYDASFSIFDDLEALANKINLLQNIEPEEEEDKGKAALTELFNGVKNGDTPIIVENIVGDIDEIVKITRFDGWQATTAGVKEVKKQLRAILWMRYKLKDQALFDKAYSYIELYY